MDDKEKTKAIIKELMEASKARMVSYEATIAEEEQKLDELDELLKKERITMMALEHYYFMMCRY